MIKFLAGAFLLLFSFTAAAQTPEDSVAFAGARWQITPLAAGAECRRAQIDMFDSRQTVSVVAYPARNFTTERSYSSTAKHAPRASWAKPPEPTPP